MEDSQETFRIGRQGTYPDRAINVGQIGLKSTRTAKNRPRGREGLAERHLAKATRALAYLTRSI